MVDSIWDCSCYFNSSCVNKLCVYFIADKFDVHCRKKSFFDPYNLIVDQLLTVVTSKKRTLYSHTITELLTLFQAIDLNCDGNISDAEFQDAMKRLDINMTDNQLSYLLAEMRREDGRISYRGFVQSMQHHHDALQSLVEKSKKSGESSSMRRGTFFGLYKPEEVEE